MFTLETTDGNARTGILETAHGKVKTPFFMPIATKGSVKQVTFDDLKTIGTQAVISNAFILNLKPGLDVLQKFGGIHKFMQWDRTVFTDSGGFQILSKSFLHSFNDKGVYFKDPYQGTKSFFTPEDIMRVGETIGSDVTMALDFVPHYGNDYAYIAECTRLTHLWAERCNKAHTKEDQLVFGICQGGTFPDLREKSAAFINSLDFDGIAIGGLGIGENRQQMFDAIRTSTPLLQQNKPRYLMGVGSPEDLVEAIGLGIDCFDSRFPTMNARHGSLFTSAGKINIEKVQYKYDETPIDEGCGCPVCTKYTKAYLHHIYRTYEPIRDHYGNIHNLYFLQKLMEQSRTAIIEGRFAQFQQAFLSKYKINEQKKSVFTYF